VIPLLRPAIVSGGHGMAFIMKPPVLHKIPVSMRKVMAVFLLKLDAVRIFF
jgi:hypothetical protein|tara:strand:- start:1292 stop:1444 length:153 start_codon:yes stop_codon:yes gene_type:complete